MRAFKKLLAKTSKSIRTIGLAAALAVLVPASVVLAGFGPSDPSVRPTYDWNKFNPSLPCTDPANAFGRCGAQSPVFDSFLNTPSYGDEEEFNQIAPVVAGQSPVDASYGATATAQAGQQYWVRLLVHNDANQTLDCAPAHLNAAGNDCTQVDPGSPGIATGTTVRFAIPSGTANGIDVMGYISATNASPNTVWDSSTLSNNSNAFSVSYVPGSAVLYNGAHQSGLALPDSIATTGTPIGFNQMDGVVPGCFNYSAYVFVKVSVQTPGLTIKKQVRLNPTDKWADNVTASKGQTEYWRITFQNNGTQTDNDVTISDTMPQGLTLVPHTIKWFDANNNGTVQPDNALNGGGVDLGNYLPVANGINGVIEFQTTVNSTVPSCTLTNVAYGRAQNVGQTSSSATVSVANCNVPTPPTKLPSTGPGSVAGIFAGVTAAGAAGYRWFLGRRLLGRG